MAAKPSHNKLTQYRVGGSSCTSGGSLYTYGYDSNGNTTSITRPDATVETLVYDYENRMTQYKYPGQTVIGTYAYDGDGHRTQKVESGTTTNYLFDGDRVQAEYDSNWNLVAKYTLEADSYFSPLVSMRRSSTSSWHLYDALGSTRKLINSSQTATDSYSYEAFGDITGSSGSTVNPYRYVGSLGYNTSSAVPFLHVGARWYAPGLGRFVTQDRARDGLNWYLYADSSPANWVDPTGLFYNLLCARRVGQYALRAAAASGLPGVSTNGPGDAYRHCLWNCLMVKECGAASAALGATLYEYLGWSDVTSPMDMHNNEVGRGLGRCTRGTSKTCDQSCRTALREGRLTTLTPPHQGTGIASYPGQAIQCPARPGGGCPLGRGRADPTNLPNV